tara:strand:- start:155 stop:1645 length:1491 start_codon:yes stop_codon:yes gene_type:complete
MASTYRSPETVVISEAAATVNTINSLADTFVKTSGRIKAIKDEKVKKSLEANARLVKDITIDPTAFYKALGDKNADRAYFDQLNNLMDQNAKLQLDIEGGVYSQSDYRDLMAKKNSTMSELSQMVGVASSEKTANAAWIENYGKLVDNATNEGGISLVGSENYIAARNIFAGLKKPGGPKGKVKRVFKNNILFYEISGEGLDKPYETPATGFLSNELYRVPNLTKEWKNILEQSGLTKGGAPTEYFKSLSEKDYNAKIAQLISTKVKGFVKDRRTMNSAFVEILGGEAAFEQYDGSEEGTEGRLPGSQVSNADTTKFTEYLTSWAANNTPQYTKPKPPTISAADKKLARDRIKYKTDSNIWKETFEEKKSLFGFGKNPKGGAYTGSIDMFKDTQEKDEDGNLVNVLEPNFIKALSEIGPGYRVVSTTGGSGGTEVTVSRTNNKGGTVTFVEGSTAQNFIDKLYNYEFEGDEGYGPDQAKTFANQFIKDGRVKLTLP